MSLLPENMNTSVVTLVDFGSKRVKLNESKSFLVNCFSYFWGEFCTLD